MALELYDSDFLIALDKYPHRETFCRIIALNWDENPVAEITANVASGSISVDGSSNVRRTCSLSLVTDTLKVDTIVWRYQTKIKVYIGLRNHLKYIPEYLVEHPTWAAYDDIIWFPQGTFIITSFNSSSNNNGYTINIQAKDKMCLLDGSVGGNLWASHEFSIVWTQMQDGSTTKTYIPIYDIIRESIHNYAFESYENIIINDLDTCGVELIEYLGDNASMYIFKQRLKSNNPNEERPWTDQIAFDITSGSLIAWFEDETTRNHKGSYEWATPSENNEVEYLLLKKVSNTSVDKVVGYRATDLTYPGELTIPVGGTITDMLKKICEMLGEFEFFYDLEGHFVFQRKKIYVNSVWTNTVYDGTTRYYDSMMSATNLAYDFLQGTIIESFTNTPKLDAIKNDYSVWGKRKTATGKEYSVHLRYAIDKKPTFYHSLLENKTFISTEAYGVVNAGTSASSSYGGSYDWRHLIYLMAKDNLRANGNILALQSALAQGYYHCDNFSQINNDSQNGTALDLIQIYRYNTLTKKFERIKTKKDLEYCINNQIFIYANDKNKKYRSPGYIANSWVAHMSEILGYDYHLAQLGSPYFREEERNKTLELELIEEYQLLTENSSLTFEIQEWQQTFNTGYESYYSDMLAFWPEIYKLGPDYQVTPGLIDQNTQWKVQSYSSTAGEVTVTETTDKGEEVEVKYDPATQVNDIEYVAWGHNGHWNPNLFCYEIVEGHNLLTIINPEGMRFWIEFVDVDNALSYGFVEDNENGEWYIAEDGRYTALSGTDKDNFPTGTKFYSLNNDVSAQMLANDLAQYSVRLIGRRSKYIKDDKVTSIYFRDTPSLLFTSSDFEPVAGQENLNYTRINIAPPISNYFKISTQGKSAKEVLDSLLQEGTYSQESISLTTIPIYYLQPNTRIGVHDDSTNISGEYIIKSFSIPLAYDGMMTISAGRVTERII